MPYSDELVVTVIETSENSATVLCTHPSLRHHNHVGIITFTTSLDKGLMIAYENLLVWEVTGKLTTMSLETSAETTVRKKSSIALSDKAWETLSIKRDQCGYNFKGLRHPGIFAFLEALIQHNPTPEMWTDTRHLHSERLDLFDSERLRRKQLPLWSDAPNGDARIRKPRGIIAEYWTPLIPAYAALGQHYGIAPYRGGSFDNPSVVATATLEAIGCGYLTPTAWPVNPAPHQPSRGGARVTRAREAQRVYESYRL